MDLTKFKKYTLCYRESHYSFHWTCEYGYNSIQECDKRHKELMDKKIQFISCKEIQNFWEPLLLHKYLISKNLVNRFHFKENK